MMTSAFIAQLRRKYQDQPRAAQVSRETDGVATLYNLGRERIPIIENSYSLYLGTSALVETTDYSLDKDTGDLQLVSVPASGLVLKANFKYANFRDQHWVDGINDGINKLNARGFTRQIIHDTSSLVLSANTQTYAGPTNCKDLYQILLNDGQGNLGRISGNWNYQEDANKVVLGWQPTKAISSSISYTRRLIGYQATTATLDVRDEWQDPLEKYAGSYYFSHLAAETASKGNATVEEGHFSFSNMRAQSKDLLAEAELEARRMKPTAPAKDILFHIEGGGAA